MQEKELSCGQVAAIFGGLVIVGIFLWQMPAVTGESDKWASWVQAFGSIGAIMGAFLIANSARRHEANQRKMAERDRAVEKGRVGYMLAKEAMRAFDEVSIKVRGHSDYEPFQPETRRLNQIAGLLQDFITGDCPPEMATDLIWLQGQIAHALEHIEKLEDERLIEVDTIRDFDRRYERAIRTAARVRRGLARIQGRGKS